jgi:hypothetical protein
MSLKPVEVGDKITAAFENEMVAEIRANRIVSVRGGRIRRTEQGTTITISNSLSEFPSPHKVTLQGFTQAKIRAGLVNLLEHADKQDEEFITLDFKPAWNKQNRAWIGARCLFDESWKVTEWQYVHTTKPFAGDAPGIGGLETLEDGSVIVPIAMLAKLDNGTTRLVQCVMHNIIIRTRPDGAASGKARHLAFAS